MNNKKYGNDVEERFNCMLACCEDDTIRKFIAAAKREFEIRVKRNELNERLEEVISDAKTLGLDLINSVTGEVIVADLYFN